MQKLLPNTRLSSHYPKTSDCLMRLIKIVSGPLLSIPRFRSIALVYQGLLFHDHWFLLTYCTISTLMINGGIYSNIVFLAIGIPDLYSCVWLFYS